MIRRIYHGSNTLIQKPTYGAGKPYNDYGLGFYCTETLDMAKEWSASKDNIGYANIYDIDCTNLNILNLNHNQYCILHWLALLLENREFDIPSALAHEAKAYILEHFQTGYNTYDIIIGYRADDSYFSYAQDFINGTISYRQLNNAMHLGQLGQQFVLKSKAAFEQIQYIGHEVAFPEEWYTKRMLRDRAARREYFDMERNKRQKGDIYITQIMDEEMMANDSRLR